MDTYVDYALGLAEVLQVSGQGGALYEGAQLEHAAARGQRGHRRQLLHESKLERKGKVFCRLFGI